MRAARFLILASAALMTPPLLATATSEPAYTQDPNGEFLFKHYPPRALAAGEQGKVGFRVHLDDEGNLKSCEVVKSSGFASLDNETCEMIVRYARFTPVRGADGRGTEAIRDGFVNWQLPAGTAVKRASASRTASADPDKLICKRKVRTGSLVGTEKQCMTRAEWARQSNLTQDDLSSMQGRGGAWDGMVSGD
jgi:TonB family protein